MRVRVQVIVESAVGDPTAVHDVACIQRAHLMPRFPISSSMTVHLIHGSQHIRAWLPCSGSV